MAPTTILDNLSDTELKRFAICFLHCSQKDVDWASAAAIFDPNIKTASFKTVTLRAIKKLNIDTDNNEGTEVTANTTKATKAKKTTAAGPKKRTVTAREDSDDVAADTPSKKLKAEKENKIGTPVFTAINDEAEDEDDDKDMIKEEVESEVGEGVMTDEV